MDLPKNRFRARLKAGEQQIGLWSTIPEVSAVDALAGAFRKRLNPRANPSAG
jgi:2-keto-3-deoxy-L-rhamnonate aldolase RhmA